MQREIIRVEPIDSNFEKWGAPVSTCTRAGNMVFVSGMPPFDPETGEILVHAPFERQVELILEQVKKALEAAGSDLDHVLKCNVLCISADRFKAFNEVYKRYFPKNPPARIFFCVPEWTGPFDVEVDCVAVTKSGKLVAAAPGDRQGRMASGRALSARRLHRHQHVETRRECCRLLQQVRHVRAMDQGGQGSDQMDAAVMPQFRRQRRPSPASPPLVISTA